MSAIQVSLKALDDFFFRGNVIDSDNSGTLSAGDWVHSTVDNKMHEVA